MSERVVADFILYSDRVNEADNRQSKLEKRVKNQEDKRWKLEERYSDLGYICDLEDVLVVEWKKYVMGLLQLELTFETTPGGFIQSVAEA